MDNLATFNQQRLNLQGFNFSRIDHENAMVAIVYKVSQSPNAPYILKISSRPQD